MAMAADSSGDQETPTPTILTASPASWRSDLSKVDVWYASFGSNMWKQRFLCYIQGGQAAGMKKACVGAMDKTPPKEITWGMFPNKGSFPLAKAGWYGNVVCVGKESDTPILTMTCTMSVIEKFLSGEVPLRPPPKAYANTLVRGLVEGGIFSE